MQIHIALIPLITSIFVFYTWELPDATIRIFMFLTHLFLAIKTIYLNWLYFENTLVKPSRETLRNFCQKLILNKLNTICVWSRYLSHLAQACPAKWCHRFCILITSYTKLDLHTNYFRRQSGGITTIEVIFCVFWFVTEIIRNLLIQWYYRNVQTLQIVPNIVLRIPIITILT
jgi:hypothetical protein